MKKCSKCGSVCSDDESKCGVCGSSLEGAVSVSLGEASRIEESLTLGRKHVGKTGIAILLLGAALAVSGGFSMVLFGPLGLAMLVVGVFVVMVGIDSVSAHVTRPLKGGTPSYTIHRGRDSAGMRSSIREIEREHAEERDAESGAED